MSSGDLAPPCRSGECRQPAVIPGNAARGVAKVPRGPSSPDGLKSPGSSRRIDSCWSRSRRPCWAYRFLNPRPSLGFAGPRMSSRPGPSPGWEASLDARWASTGAGVQRGLAGARGSSRWLDSPMLQTLALWDSIAGIPNRLVATPYDAAFSAASGWIAPDSEMDNLSRRRILVGAGNSILAPIPLQGSVPGTSLPPTVAESTDPHARSSWRLAQFHRSTDSLSS